MDQPGLQGRHRNKTGEISRKHGNTRIGTLRKIYGPGFAAGFDDSDTLKAVLDETGERSLTQFHLDQLHQDHDDGSLADKIEAEDRRG